MLESITELGVLGGGGLAASGVIGLFVRDYLGRKNNDSKIVSKLGQLISLMERNQVHLSDIASTQAHMGDVVETLANAVTELRIAVASLGK